MLAQDDIPQLLKKVKAKRVDSKKWLLAIAVENYDYTDSIKYSKNSAKNFVKRATCRLSKTTHNLS